MSDPAPPVVLLTIPCARVPLTLLGRLLPKSASTQRAVDVVSAPTALVRGLPDWLLLGKSGIVPILPEGHLLGHPHYIHDSAALGFRG